jgi:hypothetical protein
MEAQVRSETLVRIALNTMLDALTRGDFAVAAREQERLRELGWYISREAPRSRRCNARQQAAGRDGGR